MEGHNRLAQATNHVPVRGVDKGTLGQTGGEHNSGAGKDLCGCERGCLERLAGRRNSLWDYNPNNGRGFGGSQGYGDQELQGALGRRSRHLPLQYGLCSPSMLDWRR